MSYSAVTYTPSSATTGPFSVTFPYISKEHVQVRKNGVLLTVTTNYTWPTDSTISLTAACAAHDEIEIRRSSSRSERIVNHQDASNLTEATLDEDATQMFYVAQEAFDAAVEGKAYADGLITDGTGNPIVEQLASTDTGDGAAMIGFKRTAAASAVDATLQRWLSWQAVTPQEFMTEEQRADVVAGALTLDVTTPIQNAISFAATLATDALVYLPPGNYRTTGITGAYGVSIVGAGGTVSVLHAHASHGIQMNWTDGWGDTRYSNFGIQGHSNTTQIGIYQAGTEDQDDVIYGVTLEGLHIRGFNIGMKFRTIWNWNINRCWVQDCNGGIFFEGKCIVVGLAQNKFVVGAGCGTGNLAGLSIAAHTYTIDGGVIRPETIHVNQCTFYGHEWAIDIASSVYVTVSDSDLQAQVGGVKFSSASGGLFIRGNYIEVVSATAVAGVWGQAQNMPIDSNFVIAGNHIDAVALSGAVATAIQVGTPGLGGNVNNFSIRDNSLAGWSAFDIDVYASGNGEIVNNHCYSTTPANSIRLSALQSGTVTRVAGNHANKVIAFDVSALANGRLDLGANTINGGTPDRFNAEGSFTGTLTGVTGSVTGTFRWVKQGNVVTITPPYAEFTGTSNATTKTITGAPSAIMPSIPVVVPGPIVRDNGGACVLGLGYVLTTGVMQFLATAAGSSWTSGGTCGITIPTFSYVL